MKNHVHKGAWIIATYKALSSFDLDQPVFDPFETTIIAGRAGELFSAIRSLGYIIGTKFDAYRKLSKLRPSEAQRVLEIAEKLESVDISWSTDPDDKKVERIKFINNSKEEVFELTGKLFDNLKPTKIENAILKILSSTILIPQTVEDIKRGLITSKFSDKDADDAIKLAVSLKLINKTIETEKGQNILFNPNAFEGNAVDAFNAVNGLDSENKQKAIEILEFVKSNPGIPLKRSFDTKVIQLLINAGLIDYSRITTSTKRKNRYFPTAPHIWGVFAKSTGFLLSDDLIDDSKLLLNSLRYGQYFAESGMGVIKNPYLIVNALIRDGVIGSSRPATNIGTDYPLALSRGIVNIVESRIHPGRYSMELMKVDVAEAVRDILDKDVILPSQEKPSADDLEKAGQIFTSPHAVRVETELPNELREWQEAIIFSLRTMRKGR